MTLLTVGWCVPAAVAAAAFLHLVVEHPGTEPTLAGAALVLHGHVHTHDVAPHDHGLAVGVTAPAMQRHFLALLAPAEALAHGNGPTDEAEDSQLPAPSRGSPQSLRLLQCSLLS